MLRRLIKQLREYWGGSDEVLLRTPLITPMPAYREREFWPASIRIDTDNFDWVKQLEDQAKRSLSVEILGRRFLVSGTWYDNFGGRFHGIVYLKQLVELPDEDRRVV